MNQSASGYARCFGMRFPDAGISAAAPAIGLLVVLWLLIFNQQRLEWSVNVIYAYGWAVPAMAVFLLWERRRTRPVSRPPSRAFALAGLAVAAALLVAYLPVRVIQEANPDWVKINWSLAALGVGVAWLVFALAGGARQALHFTFPLLFCFTALPWPVWLDNWLVQSLMRGNATVCAELLTWMGTPALAEGNLIQVAERWVNVEEACSGIRSLQTAFMMSLFLGELHRLTVLRRLGLVAASFGVAFLLNIGRTLLLTRLTVSSDEALVDRWHDPVGVVAMILCLVALWALSEWFRPRRSPSLDPRPSPLDSPRHSSPLPASFALAGILWLVSAEFLTGAWYRYHERRVPPALAWDIDWPEKAPKFKRGEFAERTLALLKFNTGDTASWQAEDAYPWQMYALHWNPGRVSKFLSSAHHPTVCLPATGLQLVRELGNWECLSNGVRLPFSTYLFAQNGQDVYVFHAIVEDRPRRDGEPVTYRQVDTSERLRSVGRGERNLGQHVVGIALLGASSPGDAREIAQRVLDSVIHTQP
ncbi:MAG: exosortase/archaeosortase family protein [Opitutaceae bacterium]|nr:exosortase/archaeosortase family protein [Opitutaceae bacterium]